MRKEIFDEMDSIFYAISDIEILQDLMIKYIRNNQNEFTQIDGNDASISLLMEFLGDRDFTLTSSKMSNDYPTTLEEDTLMCESWSLNSNQIVDIIKYSNLINGSDWHYLYSHLPCIAECELDYKGTSIRAEINAGSWLSLFVGDTSVWLGDTLKEHEPYFMHNVWKVENDE